MHELSIATAVVDRAADIAAEHQAVSVEMVRLRVGQLAGVVAAALRFSFGLAAEGTVVARAELVIEDVPALARCGACDGLFPVGSPPSLCCPHCDRGAEVLVSGRELELVEVRLEGADVDVCLAAPAAARPRGEDT